jgi:hypothetical protein
MKLFITYFLTFIVVLNAKTFNDTTNSENMFYDDDLLAKSIDRIGKIIGVKEKEYKKDEDEEIVIYKFKIGKKREKVSDEYPVFGAKYGDMYYNSFDYKDYFQKFNFMELYWGENKCYTRNNIIKKKTDYYSFTYAGYQLNKNNVQNNKVKYDLWSLGITESENYGYKFGEFEILPNFSSGLQFTKVAMKNKHSFSDTMLYKYLDRYEGNLRISRNSSYGFGLKLYNLGLGVNYDQQLFYPRLVFWKVVISYGVEKIFENILENFVDDIPEQLKPIFHTLFMGGLDYAWMKIRKENLNWPYKSEKPMMFEKFSVNLQIQF